MTDFHSIAADSALAKSLVQEEKLFRLAKSKSVVANLISGGVEEGRDPFNNFKITKSLPNAPIVEKTFLEGAISKGGRCQFRAIGNLGGDGVSGDTTLSGKGETLDEYTLNMTVQQYRHAIKVRRLDKEFAIDNIEGEHKDALSTWGGEKIDKLAINAWVASPTGIVYPDLNGKPTFETTVATAKDALVAEKSELTPRLIQFLTTYSKTGGTGTTRKFKKIAPITNKGRGVKYVMIAHPHCLYDLKRNTEYRQEVRDRAANDTFFTDAVAIIDNTVVFESDLIPLFTNATGVTGCQAVFTGAASLAIVWGRRPFTTKEVSDHEAKKEVGWTMIQKTQKLNFNSIDWNSIQVMVSVTDIAG